MDTKTLIQKAEAKFVYYKRQLEWVHRNKLIFQPENELVIWYKAFLREAKNEEEKWLKRLIKQRTEEL